MTPDKRGPGRPRKEESAKREHERRRRKSATQTTGRLGCDPDLLESGFKHRWINDQPGRVIAKTKHDDWDMVPQNGVKDDSSDLGDMVSVVVGTLPDGSPKRAYLCRKPIKYYEEDKAAEQAKLDEQLRELRRGHDRQGAAQSDYVPTSGIRIGGAPN
jgi:hypothetical protein